MRKPTKDKKKIIFQENYIIKENIVLSKLGNENIIK